MKKAVAVIGIMFIFTGCFNNKISETKKENINDSILSIKVKDEEIFKNTKIIDQNSLLTDFGLTNKEVKDFVIGIPMLYDKSEIYIAIKPVRKHQKLVKEKVNNYLNSMETILIDSTRSLNEPEQEQAKKEIENKFSNKVETKINGYLIYIVSSENDKVLKVYKKHLK